LIRKFVVIYKKTYIKYEITQVNDELNFYNNNNKKNNDTRNVNVLLRYLPFLSLLFQCTNSASWIITNFYSFISLGTRECDEERPRDKKEKCSRSRHGRILANSATSGEFLQRSTVSYRPLCTRTRIFLDKIFLTGRARSYLSEGRRPLADTS